MTDSTQGSCDKRSAAGVTEVETERTIRLILDLVGIGPTKLIQNRAESVFRIRRRVGV